ncbi:MAG: flagellar motor switch protein FliN [Rhizobiaceae bacterium]
MSAESAATDSNETRSATDLLADSERELDKAISELGGQEPAADDDKPARDKAEAEAMATPQRRSTDNRVVMSIPVDVEVVLGKAEMRVSELMALKRGATVVLDRRIGEPVDVVVSGKRIACGEIIVLEEDSTRFGIRLTDVVEN